MEVADGRQCSVAGGDRLGDLAGPADDDAVTLLRGQVQQYLCGVAGARGDLAVV